MWQHDGNHGQTYGAKMEARVLSFPCFPVSPKGKSPTPWANWTTSLILASARTKFGRSGPAAYPIPNCPIWRDWCQVGETLTWQRFFTGLLRKCAGLSPGGCLAPCWGISPEGWENGTAGICIFLTHRLSPPGNTYGNECEGLPFFQG